MAPRNFTWDIGEAMKLERLPYDPSEVVYVRGMGADSSGPGIDGKYLIWAATAIVLIFIFRKK